MKVLLQNEETRLYYGGDNRWVAEITEAVNLGRVDKAARKALEFLEMPTSVIVKFEDSNSELAINPAFCISGPAAPSASLPQRVAA